MEAELLEAARESRVLSSRPTLWLLLGLSLILSIASLLQSDGAAPGVGLDVVALSMAVAAAVALISAGTLILHGSRESRWDAPVTVGTGSLLLGIGTLEHALRAAEVANNVTLSNTRGVFWALTALAWVGLSMLVGGLVWRSETGWGTGTRIAIVGVTMATAPLVSTAWVATADPENAVVRGASLGFALILVVTAMRMVRHNRTVSVFEGGAVLGFGLSLALILRATSVSAGDIAAISSLTWLVVAGILTAVWFDRQAALRHSAQRQQSERQLRLIEDTSLRIAEANDDRSRLRHNGASSLVAIEGALAALEASSARGDIDAHQRMTRVLAAEIGRLRRMLVAANADPDAVTNLAEAAEPVIQLARVRGQLVVADLDPSLHVRARPDAVAEVVHNLLDNAATHAPGAVVAVETTADGNTATLVVHDDGPGVAARMQATLFERGSSSRDDPDGGVGLYSARNLARQAGGDLVLAETGSGACFILTLPLDAVLGSVAHISLVHDDSGEAVLN